MLVCGPIGRATPAVAATAGVYISGGGVTPTMGTTVAADDVLAERDCSVLMEYMGPKRQNEELN